MKNVIRLTGVHKIYDMEVIQVHALRGVDLTVGRGEFTAIMGASGSGKSTLLNILGCLDTVTEGTYQLDDQTVNKMDEEQLARCRADRLGFVFQSFNLLHRATSLENVELPLVYQGISRRDRLKRAREALGIVGLADRMDHMPYQLSGGQQQRVALARALVTRPSMLLADEPTGNLDSQTAQEVLELLLRLHDQEDLTVVMVTHDADIAAFARRVVILRDGEVAYDQATPAGGGPAIPHVRSLATGGQS